jgi:fimbrial isopeptide formation D2 family protein
MPSPVKLDITLEATGDTPKAGAVINYVITIKNNTSSPVDHLAVWDTLPDGMTFNGNNSEITPTQNGNYLYWDITTDSENVPFTLEPGKEITIEFTAKIQTIDVSKLPLANTAMTDYNDPFYIPAVGKHPAIESKVSFYPVGRAVVYPNPFNLDKDSAVIFNNVVPGSLIQIYTLSGENVKAIQVRLTKSDAAWDSTNRNGRKVSPGIYYFVIKNMSNGDIKKGKIFVIKGN